MSCRRHQKQLMPASNALTHVSNVTWKRPILHNPLRHGHSPGYKLLLPECQWPRRNVLLKALCTIITFFQWRFQRSSGGTARVRGLRLGLPPGQTKQVCHLSTLSIWPLNTSNALTQAQEHQRTQMQKMISLKMGHSPAERKNTQGITLHDWELIRDR